MSFLLTAVIVLGGIALIAALILYFCSKKFAVQEDPRIAQVTAVLPGANCGGCGFAGCSGLATALVKAADGGSLEGLNCPVGGADVMGKAADLLGMAVAASDPMVAVVRCNGTCTLRPRIAVYDGLSTCSAMNATGAGETACGYGCLGCGDCVAACQNSLGMVSKILFFELTDAVSIDINDLAQGFYVVEIITNQGKTAKKLFVLK